MVDGEWQQELSAVDDLPDGITVSLASQLGACDLEAVLSLAGTLKADAEQVLVRQNLAAVDDILVVDVAARNTIDKPLQVLYIDTGSCSYHSMRVLIRVGEGGRLSLIEQFAGHGASPSLSNAVSECFIEEGGALDYSRLNLEEDAARHVGSAQFALGPQASLRAFCFAAGSELVRNDIGVDFRGEKSIAILNGVYLPRNNDCTDYHTELRHRVPNTEADENFRGIVSDRGRAIFNGRIHIHQDAQKTLAEMSNRNLLANEKAEVFTKPELEIYADDVQCAHGATVAMLDESALHYLLSRGLDRNEARTLLSLGFVNELINEVGFEPLKKRLLEIVRVRLKGTTETPTVRA